MKIDKKEIKKKHAHLELTLVVPFLLQVGGASGGGTWVGTAHHHRRRLALVYMRGQWHLGFIAVYSSNLHHGIY